MDKIALNDETYIKNIKLDVRRGCVGYISLPVHAEILTVLTINRDVCLCVRGKGKLSDLIKHEVRVFTERDTLIDGIVGLYAGTFLLTVHPDGTTEAQHIFIKPAS